MDIPTFLIRFVEALAWPIAAVIIVVTFRHEFRALMPLIRRLKAGPVEAEFEREVREISQDSREKIRHESEQEADPPQQLLIDLARVDPRSAILAAWREVESVVRKAALQRIASSPPPDVSSPLRAMRELVEAQEISQSDAALFHDLRGLRNQAAHLSDFNPSEEAALNYVGLASQLKSRLEGLAAPSAGL